MTFNPLDRNGFIFAVGMLWQKITEKIDSLPVNGNPVGTVILFMGNNAPINYLKCDGTVYNISAYSVLANFFKSEFGSFNYFGGNGSTTFAVPDLRGEFLRGTGTATRNTGSGANVGVHQDGTEHIYIRITNAGGAYFGYDQIGTDQINEDITLGEESATLKQVLNDYTQERTNTGRPMFYTSRPTNTSVLYCIKYK